MDKCIFFDYAGLLFECKQNEETLLRSHKIVNDYLGSNGNHIDLLVLKNTSTNVAMEYLKDNRKGLEWPLEKIVTKIFNKLNIPLSKQEIEKVSEIYKLHNHDYFPIGDVKEQIPRLSEKFNLGIISNSTHNSLVYELKEYCLYQYFQTVTFSYEIGVRKPNPKIYLEALRRSNISPDKSLFVSHEEAELDGAKKVGMNTYLINQENNLSLKDLWGVKW